MSVTGKTRTVPCRYVDQEGRPTTRWSRPGQPEVAFGAILALAGRAAHLEAVRRLRQHICQSGAPVKRLVVNSALATALALFGGMFLGVAIGSLLHGLPFHAAEQTKVALASIPALVGTIGGGALWGYLLARIHRIQDTKRMSVAGGISFGPAVVASGLLLSTLERALVEQGRLPGMPIHVVFTLLFVPSTFLVAAVGGFAMALGSRNQPQWFRFTLTTGVPAALAFLVVNLAMDSVGWRVGGPRAAERATMLTVMFLGASAAALSAGAVLGSLLAKASLHGLPAA